MLVLGSLAILGALGVLRLGPADRSALSRLRLPLTVGTGLGLGRAMFGPLVMLMFGLLDMSARVRLRLPLAIGLGLGLGATMLGPLVMFAMLEALGVLRFGPVGRFARARLRLPLVTAVKRLAQPRDGVGRRMGPGQVRFPLQCDEGITFGPWEGFRKGSSLDKADRQKGEGNDGLGQHIEDERMNVGLWLL